MQPAQPQTQSGTLFGSQQSPFAMPSQGSFPGYNQQSANNMNMASTPPMVNVDTKPMYAGPATEGVSNTSFLRGQTAAPAQLPAWMSAWSPTPYSPITSGGMSTDWSFQLQPQPTGINPAVAATNAQVQQTYQQSQQPPAPAAGSQPQSPPSPFAGLGFNPFGGEYQPEPYFEQGRWHYS